MFDWLGDAIANSLLSIFGSIVTTVGQTLASVLIWVLEGAFFLTDPRIDAPWVRTWASRVFAIAIPVVVIFMAVQVILASLRARSLTGLGPAVMGAAKALLATMLSLPVLHLLISGVDSIANGFLDLIGADIQKFSAGLRELFDLTASDRGTQLLTNVGDVTDGVAIGGAAAIGTGGLLFLLLVMFLIGLVATLVLVFVLMLRTQLLYVAVVALPLAFAGLASEPTRGWPKRILGMIAALTVAKLGIVVVLGIGISAMLGLMQSDDWAQAIGAMMTMGTMLVVAGFIPKIAFNFFDFLDGEASLGSAGAGSVATGAAGGSILKRAVAAGSAALAGPAGGAAVAGAGAAGSAGAASTGAAAAGAAGRTTAASGGAGGRAAGAAGRVSAGSSGTGTAGSSSAQSGSGGQAPPAGAPAREYRTGAGSDNGQAPASPAQDESAGREGPRVQLRAMSAASPPPDEGEES